MGQRSSYAPGTFSWVDLATTDAGAATSFYTGLFGWDTEDTDAGGGAVYTTCRIDGDAVCGLFEMSEEMRATGVPPNWTSYVTVADADAAATRAKELGGDAVDDAFEVLDAGRMAVLKDPQGAVFAVWQPRARIGAERVNDVGCLCMNELATTDLDAARTFYEGVFGWTTEMVDTGPGGPPMVARVQRRDAQRELLCRARRASLRTGARTSRSSRPRRPSPECASSAARRSPVRCRSPTGASRSCATRRAPCSRSSRARSTPDRLPEPSVPTA